MEILNEANFLTATHDVFYDLTHHLVSISMDSLWMILSFMRSTNVRFFFLASDSEGFHCEFLIKIVLQQPGRLTTRCYSDRAINKLQSTRYDHKHTGNQMSISTRVEIV